MRILFSRDGRLVAPRAGVGCALALRRGVESSMCLATARQNVFAELGVQEGFVGGLVRAVVLFVLRVLLQWSYLDKKTLLKVTLSLCAKTHQATGHTTGT